MRFETSPSSERHIEVNEGNVKMVSVTTLSTRPYEEAPRPDLARRLLNRD